MKAREHIRIAPDRKEVFAEADAANACALGRQRTFKGKMPYAMPWRRR
jgi:hypothetical protein